MGKRPCLKIGLKLEDFVAQLNSIITKITEELGANFTQEAAIKFAADLHLEDLYLTTACAHNSEQGWNRLANLYGSYITKVAHKVCSTHQEAREIADNILGHVFLDDAQGRRRIATYEGRGSLRIWLAVIIKHQALYRRELKSTQAMPLDALRHLPNPESTSELEAVLLKSRYRDAFVDSFKAAADELTERERFVLVLRFEDGITAKEIARMLDVHPSQVTRTVKQAQVKFRMAVLARLATHHGLCAEPIEESVVEVLGRDLDQSFSLCVAGLPAPNVVAATVCGG